MIETNIIGWGTFSIIYLICSILTYGLIFAYFQKSFPSIAEEYYKSHLSTAVLAALFGPIGLTAIIIVLFDEKIKFKYGLKFK